MGPLSVFCPGQDPIDELFRIAAHQLAEQIFEGDLMGRQDCNHQARFMPFRCS
jgi:hypothetical protein